MDTLTLPRQRATDDAIRILRDEQGRRVDWLGRKVGVSRQYVSDAIHGNRPVTYARAAQIAAALGVEVGALFRDDGDPPAPLTCLTSE